MGPSGAGKSTLAKSMQSLHPDRFARVPVDFFFVPRPAGVTVPRYVAAPFSYDWDAVDRALSRTGAERSTPDCDFETFVRRSESDGLPINEAPIYLMDGMRPHPRCDFLVMLELNPNEQRRRLVERDARWHTNVADRESHLAATFAAGCAELPREPDLRLSATSEIEANAARLIGALMVWAPWDSNPQPAD